MLYYFNKSLVLFFAIKSNSLNKFFNIYYFILILDRIFKFTIFKLKNPEMSSKPSYKVGKLNNLK